jgi:tagatose-1,6-bisphosphate aldolase
MTALINITCCGRSGWAVVVTHLEAMARVWLRARRYDSKPL